jgi:hypothetical protein
MIMRITFIHIIIKHNTRAYKYMRYTRSNNNIVQ